MMTTTRDRVLRENLNSLQARRPDLAVIAACAPEDPSYRVSEGAAVEDLMKCSPAGGDPIFFYGTSPEVAASSTIRASELRGARLVILFGMGLGHELMELSRHEELKKTLGRVVVVEADPNVFRLAMRTTPLAPILGRSDVSLVIGKRGADLFSELIDLLGDGANVRFLKAIAVVVSDGALRFDREFYVDAARQVREAAVHAVRRIGNDPMDHLMGLGHLLRNLGTVLRSPGLSDLRGVLRGRPAIVAATGPSLNKQFDTLHEFQDKIVIVGPDGSLKPLLNKGIRPHILTSRERTPKVADMLEGPEVPDIYLASCPVLHPRCYEVYRGPSIMAFRGRDYAPWLEIDKGILEFEGSSGNMAFKLCEWMGCDPIILVGQDLSFGEDGRTHASGTATGERQSFYEQEPNLTVPGNLGSPVRTSRTWLKFLRRYEYDVRHYSGTCINATEGGALIAGTQVMPLRAALSKHLSSPYDARSLLRAAIQAPSEQKCREDAVRVGRTLERTASAMKRVLAKCEEGLASAQGVIESGVPPAIRQDPDALGEALRSGSIAELEHRRRAVFEVERAMFDRFMMYTAQPCLVQWEMEMNGLDRLALEPPQLFERLGRLYLEWFAIMKKLVELSLGLLDFGRDALGGMAPVERTR